MIMLSSISIVILVIMMILAITILASWGVSEVVNIVYRHTTCKYKAKIKAGITVAIYVLLMIAVLPRLLNYL